MGDARLANRVREIRKAAGLTQEDLASRLGEDTSIATVSRLESGQMTLTFPWMKRLGSALGVSPHEIIAEPGRGLRMVPIIGWIAAGVWQEAVELPEGYIPAPEKIGGPRCFALRPRGDSMNLIADENSYIVVDPDQAELLDGKVYAIRNADGEATFKRYQVNPLCLKPVSSNTEHKPIVIGAEPFIVIGRVTYVAREL